MLSWLLNLVGTGTKPDFEVGIEIGTTELIIGFIAGVIITLLTIEIIKVFRSDNSKNNENKGNNENEEDNK